MGDVTTPLYGLLGFIILASIVAIETRDLLATVISVSAAGAGLAIIFLLLGAPDLAITAVVVEVVSMVLLIRVAIRRDDTTQDKARDMFNVAAGLVFLGLIIFVCVYAFRWMTPFGAPLMTVSRGYVEGSIAETGAANAVTGILLDYRAYDTLGEATVIFAGIVGAYAVLRRIGRRHDATARNDAHR